MLKVIHSVLPCRLTMRHIFIFFWIRALRFEFLKLAASFSVWRYIIGISRSPSSVKVMCLISRSWLQNSRSAQVCAPHGHSLIYVVISFAVSNSVWSCQDAGELYNSSRLHSIQRWPALTAVSTLQQPPETEPLCSCPAVCWRDHSGLWQVHMSFCFMCRCLV